MTEPPWLDDVSEQLGLSFHHDGGPITAEFFMPQIAGSGCAWFDMDNDGRLDAYLIQNGGPNGAKNQLFRQEADGRFRDVSVGSGLDVAGYGMGVAVGDVNNDGRVDIVLTEYGATRLFLNEGNGKFLDVSREAGIVNALWGTSATFVDYDRDGWLDLIVVNYVDYDHSIPCTGRGGKRDFCGPNSFGGTAPRLFRNLGAAAPAGARFQDVTVAAGLGAARGKGLGVLCADFDGDQWPDILAANDMMANHLWINQRNGKFKDEALSRGVAYIGSGASAANMGVAWADVDANGLPDLFITHIMDETHTLWMQEPRGFFQDRTIASGLASGWRSTGFGAAFVDLNRDGWPDAVWVNGGVRRNPNVDDTAPFWRQFAQRNQLFANSGNGKFRDLTEANPALGGELGMGRGMAVGDFDNDGAPDLLITQISGRAQLLRNVAPGAGHWLSIRAVIPSLKRDAYGAEITVRAGGRSFWRLLQPGYSYCSSNDPRCHYGLADADRYDEIEVLWPDGTAEVFPGGPADRMVEVRQGDGKQKVKTHGP